MQTKNKNKSQSQENHVATMESSKLMQLFEKELKDIYWAEKALTKAIPKMIKSATSQDLVQALEDHLIETHEQVERLEEVFEVIGKRPQAKKCEAMEGLIKEATELMEECEVGAMRDAAIICAAQKVEHYEIATYGTLCAFAETLDLEDAVGLLQETLDEEKNADEALTEVALTAINIEAAEEEENEDDDDEDEEDSEDDEDADEDADEVENVTGDEDEDSEEDEEGEEVEVDEEPKSKRKGL
ncbi:MAG TPA: ferritin-like domain-containing protein [Flavobacteriales bacterium]|nr:ferritin-like domain-containing protein [Flavobacteriales bacterium]